MFLTIFLAEMHKFTQGNTVFHVAITFVKMGNNSLSHCRCCAHERKLGIMIAVLFFISDFAIGHFFNDPEGTVISRLCVFMWRSQSSEVLIMLR